MTMISQSILIERPQKEVFEFTCAFEHDHDWWIGAISTEKITPGPFGVGTTMIHISKVMNVVIENKLVVTDLREYDFVSYRADSDKLAYDLLYTYEKVEGGTLFTLKADMQMGGVLAAIAPVTMRFLRLMLRINFTRLKNHLESMPAPASASV